MTNQNLQIAILYPVLGPKFATLAQIRNFSYTNTQIAQHGVPHAHFTQITNHKSQITNHKSQETKIYFISLLMDLKRIASKVRLFTLIIDMVASK